MRTDSHATILDFPSAAARRSAAGTPSMSRTGARARQRYIPLVRHPNAVTEWPAAEWAAPVRNGVEPVEPARQVVTGAVAVHADGATVLPFRPRGTGRATSRRVLTGSGLGYGSWDSLPPPA